MEAKLGAQTCPCEKAGLSSGKAQDDLVENHGVQSWGEAGNTLLCRVSRGRCSPVPSQQEGPASLLAPPQGRAAHSERACLAAQM